MRVKWAPVCNFRGPFSSKAVPQKVFELIGTDCSMTKKKMFTDALPPFWNILGRLKKPGLELLQNPGCLSGEIMTQTKKAIKFIEQPSNQCCCQ